MRTNKNIRIYFFILIGVFLGSCEKEDESFDLTNKLEFASFAVANISYKTAEVSSIIPKNYGIKIDEYGHCWSLNSSPDVTDSCSIFTQYSSNSFTSDLLGLKHNTTYYVRSYFKIGDVVNYSKELSFKTLEIKLPEVKTTEITNLRAKTAEAGGEVLNDNGGKVTSRGVCWNTTGNPTVEDSLSIDSLGLGEYKSNLKNLEIGVEYYIRAYAINEIGTGYGDIINFTTKDGIPEISTQETTNVTAIAAESGINISDDGGLDILEKGICYNKIGLPTVKDSTLFGGSGTDSFDGVLENLDVNTTYYIRSFAINEIDTIYGYEVSFITKDGIPEISTQEITNLTAIGAESGIAISGDGGLDILEKGVCYNMSGLPTIKDNAVFGSSGIDNYKAILENLNINTTYYIRSFAINVLDTIYGNELSFTTLDGILDVSTLEISEIGSTTAKGGGEVLDDEGLSIIERGICWNQSGGPTISDQFNPSGDGEGSFASNIEDLEVSKNYYVRAYAKNAVGVSYGNEISFTTHDGTPLINTLNLYLLTTTRVQCSGEVISDEGFSISSKGICWNTSGMPVITDSEIDEGAGSENFTSSINNLTEGKTYYFRAYAMNSNGVSYGNELSVHLIPEHISVQDYDGNWYSVVKIGDQIWFKENLRTTHYPDGIAINDGTGLDIENEDSPAYYFAYNDDENNVDVYGRLYTWYAATEACPDGWHMPTESDWLEMMNYIRIENAGKLKASGTIEDGTGLWKYPNTNGTDEFGLSIFPAGQRYSTSYEYLNERAHYLYSDRLQGFYFEYNNGECVGFVSNLSDRNGYSVRCIKDK